MCSLNRSQCGLSVVLCGSCGLPFLKGRGGLAPEDAGLAGKVRLNTEKQVNLLCGGWSKLCFVYLKFNLGEMF